MLTHGSFSRWHRFALGVYDKRTGTLQVAPVETARLLRMEPRARSLVYEVAGSKDQASEAAAMERREHNARLVQEFGSQRRKRQLAAAKAAQVDANQVSAGDAVLGLLATAGKGTGTKEEVISASLAHRNIPPHNPKARTADEAYRTDDLVPPSVRDALEVRKLFPAENKPEYRSELRKSKTFGEGYVLSRLHVLAATDTEVRETRARCLVFLGHLLKLLTGRQGSVLRSRSADGGLAVLADKLRMAPSVLDGILQLFYSREAGGDEGGDNRYILSKEKRGLMMAWALLLAVRAEPHSVMDPAAFQTLCDELKLKGGDLAGLYRELGCVTLRTSTGAAGGPAAGAPKTGYKVSLMPGAEEEKTLADYFAPLKLGGKKPGAR